MFRQSTGTLKSPNYPSNYPSNLNCSWTIEAKPGMQQAIQLLFMDFYSEAGWDKLYVSLQKLSIKPFDSLRWLNANKFFFDNVIA